MRKVLCVLILSCAMLSCSETVSKEKYESLEWQYEILKSELEDMQREKSEMEEELEECRSELEDCEFDKTMNW